MVRGLSVSLSYRKWEGVPAIFYDISTNNLTFSILSLGLKIQLKMISAQKASIKAATCYLVPSIFAPAAPILTKSVRQIEPKISKAIHKLPSKPVTVVFQLLGKQQIVSWFRYLLYRR